MYASLSKFVKDTKESFEKMGIIDKNGIEFLDNFSELTLQLFIISAKELNGDKLDNEENELIRYYGGNLEHLIVDSGPYEYSNSDQKSNAIFC